MQGQLFQDSPDAAKAARAARQGSFVDNMKLPIHRWFRFSAGFSAEWVEEVLLDKMPEGGAVLDPFAGSATTLLAADRLGIPSWGFEAHPFVSKVAAAKLQWHVDPRDLKDAASKVAVLARTLARESEEEASPLLTRCYLPGALRELIGLRDAWISLFGMAGPVGAHSLVWLAITSILRETSFVGTANWQYLLPNKRKAKSTEPFEAFASKIAVMASDIVEMQTCGFKPQSHLIATDARSPVLTGEPMFDLVITSPPYPNNFDYADATRLELTFWGEVSRWSDLHQHVRRHLVRACSQHSAADRIELDAILTSPAIDPIREPLTKVCQELEAIRETKAGRKSYHTMVAGYFVDLANVWSSLRPLCRQGATVCFVVGDSAPYGIHVPVNEWLGELALASGFRSFRFDKLRDRNMKWKNRKHRVPLLEGQLWVEG